jgi:hypothetical protein
VQIQGCEVVDFWAGDLIVDKLKVSCLQCLRRCGFLININGSSVSVINSNSYKG